jgi:hypothetical protein
VVRAFYYVGIKKKPPQPGQPPSSQVDLNVPVKDFRYQVHWQLQHGCASVPPCKSQVLLTRRAADV